jgi:hypothetical protein
LVDTTLRSGDTYQEVTVILQNDVPIQGIEIWFSLDVESVTDFTTDWIEVQIDTLHDDTTVIRNCKIKTAGTLVENFEWIEAHGEVGDSAFLDCDLVKVAGMAYDGSPIPPGQGVLFKLYIDVLCISDTLQERIAGITAQPFPVSRLSDPEGNTVEVRNDNCEIIFGHTLCGTLIDCTCGDINADGLVNVVDVVYMVNWMFDSGPILCPEIMGDINLYRGVSVADIVYLINYLFDNGPEPVCVRKYSPN